MLYCEKCKDRDPNCPHCHDVMGEKTSAELWRGKGYVEADRKIAGAMRKRR